MVTAKEIFIGTQLHVCQIYFYWFHIHVNHHKNILCARGPYIQCTLLLTHLSVIYYLSKQPVSQSLVRKCIEFFRIFFALKCPFGTLIHVNCGYLQQQQEHTNILSTDLLMGSVETIPCPLERIRMRRIPLK